MKKLAAVLASACASLALAGAAAALPVIGVAEDATKYSSDGGASLYDTMKSFGLSSNRVSVFWDYTKPTEIEEKAFLDKVVPAANAAGVQLIFAIYADPRPGGGAKAAGENPDAFCNYAALVAQTYPTVTKIIVGNEPNQPRFWGPQYDASGAPLSGRQFEPVQAKCYDALKAVNPAIDVIGVGLSPRGNDSPPPANNSSTSPVRFLREFSAAYRASGRQKPIMDEFAFHCYPNVNSDALAKGYQWPNVGCVNLDRLKQALWDGFNGTAQPTPLETGRSAKQGRSTLTIVLDETGWQVDTVGRTGYTETEQPTVPTISEAQQADIYSGLVNIGACDPAITALHFLYLIDSPNRLDFQSGLLRVDLSPRPSADAVKAAIARGCTGGPKSWSHTTRVIGAAASKAVVNGRRAVQVTASEDYTFSIVVTKGGRKATVVGNGKAYWDTNGIVPAGFKGGRAKITMKAWANPSRVSTLTVKV